MRKRERDKERERESERNREWETKREIEKDREGGVKRVKKREITMNEIR